MSEPVRWTRVPSKWSCDPWIGVARI